MKEFCLFLAVLSLGSVAFVVVIGLFLARVAEMFP